MYRLVNTDKLCDTCRTAEENKAAAEVQAEKDRVRQLREESRETSPFYPSPNTGESFGPDQPMDTTALIAEAKRQDDNRR